MHVSEYSLLKQTISPLISAPFGRDPDVCFRQLTLPSALTLTYDSTLNHDGLSTRLTVQVNQFV